MGYFVYEPEEKDDPGGWNGRGVKVRASSKKKAAPLLEKKWAERLALLKSQHGEKYADVEKFNPKFIKQVADPKLEFGPRLTCCKKAATKKDKYSNCPRRPLIMLAIDDLYEDEERKPRPPHWTFKG